MTEQKYLARLGKRIKQYRELKGMTQNQLAIRCSFEKANMSRIESGKVNISLLTLRKIGIALDVEGADLLKDWLAA